MSQQVCELNSSRSGSRKTEWLLPGAAPSKNNKSRMPMPQDAQEPAQEGDVKNEEEF